MTRDGTKLDGYFKDDVLDGNAEIHSKDGTTYRGEFKNGNYHGRGHLVEMEGGRKVLEYEGDFCEGIFHGHGRLQLH